jgi:hypothetical protein
MLRRSSRRAAGVAAGALLTGLALLVTGGTAVAQPTPDGQATPPPAGSGQSPPAAPTPTAASASAAAEAEAVSVGAGAAKAKTMAAARAAAATLGGYPKFYRIPIKRGDKDGDVYHIKKVRELQYRLRWAGVYTGPVTGNFGPLTETAVKKYQTLKRLPATGVVTAATWQSLIPATTKKQTSVPAICKRAGWHSCYDRSTHQLFGYYNGTLWNVWLVRGGASNAQTDVGSFTVFARYLQKNSTIYGTLMYNFQKFNGAEGVHGSISMIDPFVGHSHGCVNMYIHDSWVLWKMTAGRTHYATVYGAWS